MVATILSVLCLLVGAIRLPNLLGKYSFYLYFMDVGTEVQPG